MLKNGTKKTLNRMPHSGLLIIIKKQNASIITSKTLDGEKIFVIGGAQLYEAALPYTEWLDLTEVLDSPGNADAFFPSDLTAFLPVKRTSTYGNKIPYRYATWRRKDCISYLKQN